MSSTWTLKRKSKRKLEEYTELCKSKKKCKQQSIFHTKNNPLSSSETGKDGGENSSDDHCGCDDGNNEDEHHNENTDETDSEYTDLEDGVVDE